VASNDEGTIRVDGREIPCPLEGSLFDVLCETGNFPGVKDGCSPQGQCGCCTVLVDGVARVSCVTPARRIAGRAITTIDGVDPILRQRLIQAFDGTAASQCGFCTPGILLRLCGLARKGVPNEQQVRTALGAHLCRCTGLQPIIEAALQALDPAATLAEPRDPKLASQRASLESGTQQRVGTDVILGVPGFAVDTAPDDALMAIGTADGGYVVGASRADVTRNSSKVQGRNSTIPLRFPLAIPSLADAALTLQTTFVEPAYVEPDASWCEPGGEPAVAYANAGAFGAKRNSSIMADAQRLSTDHENAVLAQWPREEVVRRGAKRPPLSIALRLDGTGVLHIGRTPGSDSYEGLIAQLETTASMLEIEIVDIVGPRLGVTHRGAVLAEVLAVYGALGASPDGTVSVTTPNGATAAVTIQSDGAVSVVVNAGQPLCNATLRSYVIGAVHQGLGMVLSEGIAVDEQGSIHDLTIRSFGILTALQMPVVEVTIIPDERDPVAAGTAVLAAAMGAQWVRAGLGSKWPVNQEDVS